MKRKDIKTAIEAAKKNGTVIRDRAVLYLNTIELVLEQSDKERCDYYDRIMLYIMHGIEPDLESFSDTKRRQFRYIFSLLKKQRNGFINATQSSNYKNLPQGQPPQAPPDQEISNKDNKKLILKKKDGSNKETTVEVAPPPTNNEDINFDIFVDYYNDVTSGAFGELVKPLSDERKNKIIDICNRYGKKIFNKAYNKALNSDYLTGKTNGKPMTFDWMIEPSNFEKILSGNYDNNYRKIDLNILKH
jgi:hypothetical protein